MSNSNDEIDKLKNQLHESRRFSGTLAVAYIVLVVCIVLSVFAYTLVREESGGPWYLGCADRTGRELLLQTDKKPRAEGGLVFLDDDLFVTPEPGMTCRVVSIEQVEQEKANAKAIDKVI